MRKASKHNYINNEQLYQDFLRWRAEPDYETRIPDYIGKYFLLITNNLAKAGNFRNYSWTEEFIGDGLLVLCRYARNFDPNKSHNCFSYLTKLVYHVYQSRIVAEKKQLEAIALLKEEAEELYNLEDYSDDHGNLMEKIKEKDRPYRPQEGYKYIKPRTKKYSKNIKKSLDDFS